MGGERTTTRQARRGPPVKPIAHHHFLTPKFPVVTRVWVVHSLVKSFSERGERRDRSCLPPQCPTGCTCRSVAWPTVRRPISVQSHPTKQGSTLLWLATKAQASPPEPAPFVGAVVSGSGGRPNSLRSRSSVNSASSTSSSQVSASFPDSTVFESPPQSESSRAFPSDAFLWLLASAVA